ncbi:ricin B lectin domain-containing protein [Achaetomium macrosporum]|uniref:Ricin B lectin domain-containing protein n=1 Tax=Achaetomium macrosporum TaxID=79813 RepID=A0AAN7C1U6_9PEZI|nr:ricin B lectin domain-containing protein [Achaetomium macrosporum]
MGVSVKPGYIYRIRNRTSPNLILELSNGSSEDGTQAQGWSPVNSGNAFFNQIWLLTQITIATGQGGDSTDGPRATQAWTLQEIKSGTFLDLSQGGTKRGTKIQGWEGPAPGQQNPNQDWLLVPASDNGYQIINARANLAVDLSQGGSKDGTPVWGWTPDAGNTNQIWDFEQWSYSSSDLLSSIKSSMPLKSGVDVVSYTYPADPRYLILPYNLYFKIWADNMQIYKYRPVLFDCDDFAFVFKSAVAQYGYQNLQDKNVGQVALLAGIVYGQKSSGSHAFNWTMGPTTDNDLYEPYGPFPWYFEPQNGLPRFQTGYTMYFVIF